MIATGVYRGRTVKRVTVIEVEPEDSDSRILEVAMAKAGETRSSLFGSSITRYDDGIVNVDLHTD